MNLLFFSDMHGNLKVLDSLKNKAKEADGIVCSGDFTVFEEGNGIVCVFISVPDTSQV